MVSASSQTTQTTMTTIRRQNPTGSGGPEVLRLEPLPRATRDNFLFRTESATQSTGGDKMIIEQNATAAAAAVRGRTPSNEWALLLQHPAGSLDAAVEQA